MFVGSSVGPYLVVEKIGAGGMGEVFLAQDNRLNRKVALKVVHDRALEAPDARARVLHEARAAARLTHPNIAAVYDVLDIDARPCIVMEYVRGETLAERLRRGAMPCAQALSVGVQLADALAHAHAAGVVHRDLKPGNVVLTDDGTAKILDFGLARVREIAAENEADRTVLDGNMSQSHTVSGTPAYMSPEQLLGKPATPRADIYALGVLMFELLCGRRPFDGVDFMALGLAVLTDPTPRLDARMVPAAAREVVARAMAREPSERYRSASEMSSALRGASRALGDQSTIGESRRLPSLPEPAPRGRSRAAALGGGALLAVLIVLWSTVGSWLPAKKPAPAPPAAPAPVVAVLPLANLSGDQSKECVGVGVSESLIAALANAPGVTIVSHNETGRYLARREDAAKVTRDLGATLLVDGGVQEAGRSLRFTLKLLRSDSRVLWASTYEGAMSDLFQLQARAADDLASALGIAGAPRQRAISQTANLGAYADYSMGQALMAREDVAGNAGRAVAAFDRAVSKDERFALAWAGLGDACWWRYRETNDQAWASRATDAIRRAIHLDGNDARIHVSLATVYQGTGRSREAIAELRSAIASRPNDDQAHRLLADALASQGRNDEALQEYRKAIAIRPNSFRNYSALGGFFFRAGHYTQAAAAYERVIEVQPDSTWGFINLGAAYLAAGDLQRALENFQRSLTLSPEPEAYSNIGTIDYTEGRYQDAAIAYERAVALAPRNPSSHRNLGDAYLRLGARDKARGEYQTAANLTGDLLKVNPRDARTLASHAVDLAKAGRASEARRDSARAVVLSPSDPGVTYARAVVFALCGQREQAADWLQRALANGYSRALAAEDDDLTSIRALPRVRSALGNQPKSDGQL